MGNYIFIDREPISKKKESRLYLANCQDNKEKVLIRVIDKDCINKHLKEKFLKEVK